MFVSQILKFSMIKINDTNNQKAASRKLSGLFICFQPLRRSSGSRVNAQSIPDQWLVYNAINHE